MRAFPIEEYSISRGRGANRSSGRADLWIRSQNGITYDFEAKQKWVALNSNDIANTIRRPLREAVIDSTNLSQRSDFSVGIVFAVPYISTSRPINLSSFKRQIVDIASYGADFAAIHFCNETIWRNLSIEGYVYPGLLLSGDTRNRLPFPFISIFNIAFNRFKENKRTEKLL